MSGFSFRANAYTSLRIQQAWGGPPPLVHTQAMGVRFLGLDFVSDRRRFKTAALRYVFHIVYVIWTMVNYECLSCITLKRIILLLLFKFIPEG